MLLVRVEFSTSLNDWRLHSIFPMPWILVGSCVKLITNGNNFFMFGGNLYQKLIHIWLLTWSHAWIIRWPISQYKRIKANAKNINRIGTAKSKAFFVTYGFLQITIISYFYNSKESKLNKMNTTYKMKLPEILKENHKWPACSRYKTT